MATRKYYMTDTGRRTTSKRFAADPQKVKTRMANRKKTGRTLSAEHKKKISAALKRFHAGKGKSKGKTAKTTTVRQRALQKAPIIAVRRVEGPDGKIKTVKKKLTAKQIKAYGSYLKATKMVNVMNKWRSLRRKKSRTKSTKK